AKPLTLVVMDPLAFPLSCPCVKGYAQRDYEKLAIFIGKLLHREVQVHFAESLTHALKKKTDGKADIIIGKSSVIRAGAKANEMGVVQLAALTGKDGDTNQTGLLVVARKDPAKTVEDLKGYRIFFGPEECDEQYSAALSLLKDHKVPVSDKLETCA